MHQLTRLNFTPDDGYTEPGYIQPLPHVHGEFRFTFRPTLVEERSQAMEAAGQLKADACDRAAASQIVQKLVTWSLVDARQRPVPITAKNVLRLKGRLFDRLYGIILGTEASDTDPLWRDEDKREHEERRLESALTGRPFGLVREEADEKNFGPGCD